MPSERQPVRFGVFEVNLDTGEVRRAGAKVRIQEQPFQVLAALLEKPGEIVTKEELQERIWKDDTFVDFDRSLATAINKVRQALGDSATGPRFIETVAKRGYRFIGGVGDSASAEPMAHLPPGEIAVAQSRLLGLKAGMAVLAIALVSLLWLHFTQAPPPSLPVVEFSMEPPPDIIPGNASFSPDGRYLALSVLPQTSLWLRALDSDEWKKLEGTAGAEFPFWSPDSTQIGFFADGRLRKVALAGGPPQTIAEASAGRGGSWGEDGTILFAPTPFGQFQRVSESGGEPTLVNVATEGEGGTRRFPQLLPDGHHFLYADGRGSGQSGIYLGSLDGDPPRRLLPDEGNHFYTPSASGAGHGFVMFVREGVLMAQPFDAAKLELAGDAVALPVTPAPAGRVNNFGFTVSDAGLLAHTSAEKARPERLVWVDRQGAVVERTDLVVLGASMFRLSPDGTRVAYSAAQGAKVDVWTYDLHRGTRTRLTDDPELRATPVWSAQGQKVAFRAYGSAGLAMRSADGSGPITLLPAQNQNTNAADWSPDGRFLLYTWQDPVSSHDIWALERTGTGNEDWTPRPILSAPGQQRHPRLSPNGRYVAYLSDESGGPEIFVQPFPEGGQRTTISAGGGIAPVWSRDGKELFYVVPGNKVLAAQVSTEGEFSVGSSTLVLERPGLADGSGGASYNVSLDGRRFLVTESVDADEGSRKSAIRILQNWQSKYLPQP